MSGRPFISQEWSVHAQLTISRQRPDVAVTPATPRSDNGDVHMEYSWNTIPTSGATASASPSPCYGFQRGNITFTTRPPPRQGLTDSGYAGEEVTPGFYGSLPTRNTKQLPYNRRCKSTCSITLSGIHDDAPTYTPSVGRSHSLNARTSVAKDETVTYSCSGHFEDSLSPLTKDVEGVCEVCGGERSPSALRRASNYTTHFCTRVPDRTKPKEDAKQSQDAASQTLDEELNRAVNVPLSSKHAQPRMGNKAIYNTRRKTDSDLLQIPVLQDLPESDSDSKPKPGKRLSRSPARLSGNSPLLPGRRTSSSRSPDSVKRASKSRPTDKSPKRSEERTSSSPSVDSVKKSPASTSTHKPRTVHIDVYCTGSDASDSSSTSSSTDSDVGESWTSPQTVFESEKLRVVHTKAGKNSLPQALQRNVIANKDVLSKPLLDRGKSESFQSRSSKDDKFSRGYDSDDGLSSQYPSRFSSYSSIQDSSGTSRDPSSSTISSSSCAFTDDYDSAAATSWKDTATDLDSRSLIDSSLSLAPSDSFEYADSLDRLRIKQRECAWAAKNVEESKSWRSPQAERKNMLQQQKIKEFLEKHLGKSSFPLWKPGKADDSDDDDDDDDDETGDAWSFGGESFSKVSSLKREDTVRRATPVNLAIQPDLIADSSVTPGSVAQDINKDSLTFVHPVVKNTDSVPHRFPRISGPFGSRSPSPVLLKVQSSITSPFTARLGLRTDQLSKAEKFGTIIGAFRKPGHHVGPSKNPECSCVHCTNYREEIGCRSRTRSLDLSQETADNWKVQLQDQIAKRNSNRMMSEKKTGQSAVVKEGDSKAAV